MTLEPRRLQRKLLNLNADNAVSACLTCLSTVLVYACDLYYLSMHAIIWTLLIVVSPIIQAAACWQLPGSCLCGRQL